MKFFNENSSKNKFENKDNNSHENDMGISKDNFNESDNFDLNNLSDSLANSNFDSKINSDSNSEYGHDSKISERELNSNSLEESKFDGDDFSLNSLEESKFDGDDFSLNSLEESKSKIVDVRIVITKISYLEAISKAVNNFDLTSFNVVITSIISAPMDELVSGTDNSLEIVKSNVEGADLILIAAEFSEKGKKLFNKFQSFLKSEDNQVEFLKLGSGDFDSDFSFEDEIANAIIRTGLSKVSNLSLIDSYKSKFLDLRNEFENKIKENEKIATENKFLLDESKKFREENEKLKEDIKILNGDLDKIKSDYSDFKSRFTSIHTKNFLESFSLNELWSELFSENLSLKNMKFIELATDNFKPDDIIIGQGYICANSKSDALDWLKIVATSMAVVNNLGLNEDSVLDNETQINNNFGSNSFKNSIDSSYDSSSFENEDNSFNDSNLESNSFEKYIGDNYSEEHNSQASSENNSNMSNNEDITELFQELNLNDEFNLNDDSKNDKSSDKFNSKILFDEDN